MKLSPYYTNFTTRHRLVWGRAVESKRMLQGVLDSAGRIAGLLPQSDW